MTTDRTPAPIETRLALVVEMLEEAARELRCTIEAHNGQPDRQRPPAKEKKDPHGGD